MLLPHIDSHFNKTLKAADATVRLDAGQYPLVALVVFTSLLFLPEKQVCRAAETSLAILDAGLETSEDAPFVSRDYRFYPGDYVYFRFQVAGFAVKTAEKTEVRTISLAYEITPEDAHDVALTPPVSGNIDAELNPEDKNWTPKRRVSFLLPSFVAAGLLHLHVVVKDLVANSETGRDFPFQMGGVEIVPSPAITVENFRFFRKEDDREGLEVAAYSPGDTVYARFDMAGYQLAPENTYRLAYGLTVYRPDGKPYLQQPAAAELTAGSFYPAQFVPGNINLTTSRDTTRGEYTIVLTVRDLVANRTYQLKRGFSIE
jgi:hypothetical protein